MDLQLYDEDSGDTYVITINTNGTFSDIINALLEKNINIADESVLLTNGKSIKINKKYNFLNNQKIILRNIKNLQGFTIKLMQKTLNGCGWRYVSPGIKIYMEYVTIIIVLLE